MSHFDAIYQRFDSGAAASLAMKAGIARLEAASGAHTAELTAIRSGVGGLRTEVAGLAGRIEALEP